MVSLSDWDEKPQEGSMKQRFFSNCATGEGLQGDPAFKTFSKRRKKGKK